MDNLQSELAQIALKIFNESGLTKADFCKNLGINSSNWARDIESGSWFLDIQNLRKFYEVMAREQVADFILRHFNVALDARPQAVTASHENKKELEYYKELLAQTGMSDKKTLKKILELSFKEGSSKPD